MPITKLRRLLINNPDPQYMVGAACGVNPSTLTQYSLGRRLPDPDHARALAAYFSVPLEDVLGDEE